MTQVCTLEQVRDVLEYGPDEVDRDELILRLIGAASRFIERKTRRVLTTGTGARLFDGNDKGRLHVDDFISLTSVELLNVDDTVWKTFTPATELRTEPYNKTPKYSIVVINTVSENPYRIIGRSPYIFPKGFANVRVNANWGSYATVPEDLEQLGIELVVSKLSRVRNKGIASASIGGESVSFTDRDLDEGMQDTLDRFKRDYAEVW